MSHTPASQPLKLAAIPVDPPGTGESVPKLEAVVSATEKLLSPAAPKVLQLSGSREPKIDELREAVALDPLLTVKVINFANHSFYARQVPVVSVRRALVRLGWQASRELLLRLLIEGAAHRLPPGSGGPVWERATCVASLSRLIARAGQSTGSELAFTAGLTHSLGIFGLLALHQQHYASVVLQARSTVHLASQERKLFGHDHAAVGSGVLEGMAVPRALVEAVRWQYHARVGDKQWQGNQSLALAGTLQLCHRLLARGVEELPAVESIVQEPLFAKLGLTLADAEAVRRQYTIDMTPETAAA